MMERLSGIARLVLDVIYPPECPSCRVPVETMHNLCAACFAKLRMITKPMCACCGIPFAVPTGEDGKCPECLLEPPMFDRARSVMVYDGVSAPLVSALKFHDQWAGLTRYASMLCATGSELLAQADIIAPIPLHWRRLWWRKYNQSALLAYGISREKGIPCLPDLLWRTRYTKPQMRLKRSDRGKNVRNVFAVTEKFCTAIAGKNILIIDDVVTTGATVDACAKVLKKAGAAKVNVLTLARTVKE